MPTVKKIPARIARRPVAPVVAPSKRKVAAYARVSTDKDEQFTSYEAQIDYYTQYIKGRVDWEFAGVYTDEGITGTSTKHREGFKRMVSDALDGKIDLIVTKSVSRFARNTVDSLTTIRQLKEHGTEVYFEKENIWTFDSKGELLITIMSSIAQEESRSISENVTWGHRKRMSDGKVSIAFSHFLGYKRGPNGELVIDEAQAEIVRSIFAWFLQGLTPHTIAARLTKMDIPTSSGKGKWYESTVRSILTNEKYKGDALMQKYYTEDYLSKKKVVNRGLLPQYYVEGDHDAIIDPETFDLAQREFLRRKGMDGRYSGVDLFASHIVCGSCGSHYGAKVWHSNDKYRKTVYRCNAKYRGQERCSAPHLTEEQVQRAFLSAINGRIADRNGLFERLQRTAASAFDPSELEAELDRLSGEVEAISEMMDEAAAENARGDIDATALKQRRSELLERLDDIKSRYESAVAAIAAKESALAAVRGFIASLDEREEPIEEFDSGLWGTLLDHMTVYSENDIRCTFRDGTEVRVPPDGGKARAASQDSL